MAFVSFRDVLWSSAILLAWLSIISLGGAWYARARFQNLLKAPLTDEVEHLTHVWERQVRRWTILGASMSGLSLLCVAGWLVS